MVGRTGRSDAGRGSGRIAAQDASCLIGLGPSWGCGRIRRRQAEVDHWHVNDCGFSWIERVAVGQEDRLWDHGWFVLDVTSQARR